MTPECAWLWITDRLGALLLRYSVRFWILLENSLFCFSSWEFLSLKILSRLLVRME